MKIDWCLSLTLSVCYFGGTLRIKQISMYPEVKKNDTSARYTHNPFSGIHSAAAIEALKTHHGEI